jgi:hypothetical protein
VRRLNSERPYNNSLPRCHSLLIMRHSTRVGAVTRAEPTAAHVQKDARQEALDAAVKQEMDKLAASGELATMQTELSDTLGPALQLAARKAARAELLKLRGATQGADTKAATAAAKAAVYAAMPAGTLESLTAAILERLE